MLEQAYSPHQVAQLERLERLLDRAPANPHRFNVFGQAATRAELRALPLRFILVPVVDGPRLAFPDEHQGEAAVLRADLEILWQRYRRHVEPKARRVVALQARRTWARMVELAEGLQVPGARYPSVVLFAS